MMKVMNMANQSQCETCAYYEYDSEYEEYYCSINIDEDEYSRFMSGAHNSCPYYNFYDEYKMVRKQN